MRVLIIEDSEALRKIQRSILAKLGHDELADAATAADGLARCAEFKPDLVLCDASLPDSDGPQFLHDFRAVDKMTPVVLVASTSDMGAVIPALRAGADEALIKPFSPEDLAGCMADAIEARRAG
jgi:DNA-binding response OmpR family regulator